MWFLVLITIILFVFMLFSFYQVVMKRSVLDEETENMEEEAIELDSNNQTLRKMIDYLQSSDFLTLGAKNKLGMKQPDEEVIVITDQPIVVTSDESSAVAQSLERGEDHGDRWKNPWRWWNHFFRVE